MSEHNIANSKLFTMIFNGVTGMGLGFIIGYSMKKAFSFIFKTVTIVAGLFMLPLVAIMAWLSSQDFIKIEVDRVTEIGEKGLEHVSNNLVGFNKQLKM